jgi:hypothetical protein
MRLSRLNRSAPGALRHTPGAPTTPNNFTDAQRVGFLQPDFAAPQHAIATQCPNGMGRNQKIGL